MSADPVIPFPTKAKKTGDRLTARKLDLLDRASINKSLTPVAFRVLYVLLTKYLNKTTGEAQVAQETLAEVIGLTSRRLRDRIRELEREGYLRVIRPARAHPGGRAIRNRYRPIFEKTTATEPTPMPSNNPPAGTYAFNGRVIRLSQIDLDNWRAVYRHIPDIMATLQSIDDYYATSKKDTS
jgi:DNA-binding MarR family transcriptional regulator